MAIQIEKISDTQLWIHDGVTNIMEIDTTDGVRINSALKIGTDLISPSASELAAINGLTATSTELNTLAGVTAGTVTAGKAIVTTTNKHIDAIAITDGGLALGAGAGTAVTSTAAELNLVDGSVAGTAVASKALVLGTNKEADEIHAVALYTGPGAGTLISPTAAEINLLAQGVASGYKIARSAAPVALDGSNPTSVAHGLTTCVAAFVQLVGSAAPALSTSVLTAVINGANIDVYAWKPTSAIDDTLIASTGTETFNWFAIGV